MGILKILKKNRRNIVIAVAVVLLLAVSYAILVPLIKKKGSKGSVENFSPHLHEGKYDLIHDDYVSAPNQADLIKPSGGCGLKENMLMGYKYQVPEELPSVESLMPEESACSSYYDPEAAQNVPYVFTYPLTGAITKTRLEQAGDIWRGDLSIQPRDPSCDFKTIWNQGDQHLHGAFSDYTYKSHDLIGCDNKVWVRDAPINVANEELIMDA